MEVYRLFFTENFVPTIYENINPEVRGCAIHIYFVLLLHYARKIYDYPFVKRTRAPVRQNGRGSPHKQIVLKFTGILNKLK